MAVATCLRRSGVALFSVFCATLAGFSVVVPAAAQESTATAGTSTPFEETRACSAATTFCAIDFDVVPDRKRLEITSASCSYILAPATARVQTAFLGAINKSGSVLASHALVVTLQAQNSSNSYSASNNQLFLFVRGGGKIEASAGGDATSIAVSCTISGHMISV